MSCATFWRNAMSRSVNDLMIEFSERTDTWSVAKDSPCTIAARNFFERKNVDVQENAIGLQPKDRR